MSDKAGARRHAQNNDEAAPSSDLERLILDLMNCDSGEVKVAVGFRDGDGETRRLFSVLRRDKTALRRFFDYLDQEILPDREREK